MTALPGLNQTIVISFWFQLSDFKGVIELKLAVACKSILINCICLLISRPQSVDDEEFYFTDLEDDDDEAICMEPTNVAPPSPPTLSHRDMARPPHEDPEYQRKLVGNMRQGLLTAQTAVFKTTLPMSSGGCTLLPTNSSYTWSDLAPVSF